jgi:hypothetical protein
MDKPCRPVWFDLRAHGQRSRPWACARVHATACVAHGGCKLVAGREGAPKPKRAAACASPLQTLSLEGVVRGTHAAAFTPNTSLMSSRAQPAQPPTHRELCPAKTADSAPCHRTRPLQRVLTPPANLSAFTPQSPGRTVEWGWAYSVVIFVLGFGAGGRARKAWESRTYVQQLRSRTALVLTRWGGVGALGRPHPCRRLDYEPPRRAHQLV